MTQEDKELLLIDLSGRVRYGVRLWLKLFEGKEKHFIDAHNILGSVIYDRGSEYKISLIDKGEYNIEGHRFSNYEQVIKPYLRPMSSMTEEEKDYIKNVARFKQSDDIHYDDGVHYVPIYQKTLDDQWKTDGKFPPILDDIYRFMLEYGYILLIDFFNSHHLDYRGLISMGLALEAPEGMYSLKNK